MLDNPGVQECYYSCLVFLFTGKLKQILAPPSTPGLRHNKAVTSKLSKKRNVAAK